MSRIEFQERLDGLEAMVQEQGALCLRALRGAINALAGQDVELCDEVVALDAEIEARHRSIERMVAETLALQTPVASDLRLVLAVLHDSIHLERIGDQAVTIATLTRLAAGLEPHARLVEGLIEMGDRCEEMLRIALASLAGRDVEQARALDALDELVDLTNRSVMGQVLALTKTAPEMQEWGMRMVVVSRCIERVGDNIVGIGEQTTFLVTGEFEQFSATSH